MCYYKGISIILGELDMMKKFGFTLAEVLITLGIIGVVAALTAPALVQNAGTAKIGPTLAKVVSTLENANEQMLHDEDATDLSKIARLEADYYELLSKYISGSSYDTTVNGNLEFDPPMTLWDGNQAGGLSMRAYLFNFSDNICLIVGIPAASSSDYNPKGSFKGRYAYMYVDINGSKTKPNKLGKDVFYFIIDKSGSVIPYGSSTLSWLLDDDGSEYTNSNNSACNENKVGDGKACAGSIFENNMKVIYQ